MALLETRHKCISLVCEECFKGKDILFRMDEEISEKDIENHKKTFQHYESCSKYKEVKNK